MFKVEGLTAVDLLATMVSHQVEPLQHCPHLICQMGDRHDPCQLSAKELHVHHVSMRLFSRLQIYDPSAADVPESDPEKIEDVDKVEPRMEAHVGDEMSGDDMAESDGSELAGESLMSVLLGCPYDDAESS
ncbi:hypothetical protein D1007_47434 [Hordeum vulgare]|nr:hypothetical protein D1007_47434 [Hordeum vulgare]